jgi:hypothetical protein
MYAIIDINNIFSIAVFNPVRDVVAPPDVSAMTVVEFSRLSKTEVDVQLRQVRSCMCIRAILAAILLQSACSYHLIHPLLLCIRLLIFFFFFSLINSSRALLCR